MKQFSKSHWKIQNVHTKASGKVLNHTVIVLPVCDYFKYIYMNIYTSVHTYIFKNKGVTATEWTETVLFQGNCLIFMRHLRSMTINISPRSFEKVSFF